MRLMSYEVVRITFHGADGEVLGHYRWRWMARVHNAWANVGLRVARIRDAA